MTRIASKVFSLLFISGFCSCITACSLLPQPKQSEPMARYAFTKSKPTFVSGRSVELLPSPNLEMNAAVQREINYFLQRDAEFVRISLGRIAPQEKMLREILRDEGMPEELMALAMIESGFNQKAKSPMGAVGIWQFIKSTAQIYGLSVGSVADQRKDPILSTLAAARHLKDLYQIYGDWYLALAAYNAGPGTVDRLVARLGTTDFWKISNSGRLCLETRRYIPKFIAAALILRDPKKYGIGVTEEEQTIASDVENAPSSLQTASLIPG
jgi:membrane-bound lytic murein transglycosylase D